MRRLFAPFISPIEGALVVGDCDHYPGPGTSEKERRLDDCELQPPAMGLDGRSNCSQRDNQGRLGSSQIHHRSDLWADGDRRLRRFLPLLGNARSFRRETRSGSWFGSSTSLKGSAQTLGSRYSSTDSPEER